MRRPRRTREEKATSPTDHRLRAAIIGTGAVATHHLTAMSEHDDVEPVAAVDLAPERLNAFLANHAGPRGYTDIDEMLATEKPDLVSVCTPPASHVDHVTRSLRAGAWVWCEKPPCLSLAGYEEMIAAQGEHGPYVSFVFQQRFGSGARHARELLEAHELGTPLVAHCQTTWYRDSEYFAVPWRGKWETEGGGPTMGHGIHQLDLLLHLLGPWTEVRAMTGRLWHEVATEDVSTALVRFDSGAMATVVNSVLSPDEVSRIRLDCSEATVELTHLYGHSNADWHYTPAPHVTDTARIERWRSPARDEPSSHGAMLRQLVAAMREGRRPPCGGQDGRGILELVTALYKSAATGRAVYSGEIGPDDPFHAVVHGGAPEKLTGDGEADRS
ncbi:Gfo/Idh/MocA family protein [Actinopolyspora erythraea]|uniref:Gfo/Idh/MocA family protein n=1 Tax=Actinopolyspora erythraea TaxID=414996 RepID=UPI000A69D832|nr:Gfo/Idh/MocA family oxidoreductase [Actinopolyspora erythraea]